MRPFLHALRGLAAMVATQRHARIHLACAALAVGAGAVSGLSGIEWCALALCIGFVLAAEALNTALESLADAVHPEHHPLVGRAKDVAAGAVLIAALTALAVGALLFLPKTFA